MLWFELLLCAGCAAITARACRPLWRGSGDRRLSPVERRLAGTLPLNGRWLRGALAAWLTLLCFGAFFFAGLFFSMVVYSLATAAR